MSKNTNNNAEISESRRIYLQCEVFRRLELLKLEHPEGQASREDATYSKEGWERQIETLQQELGGVVSS